MFLIDDFENEEKIHIQYAAVLTKTCKHLLWKNGGVTL